MNDGRQSESPIEYAERHDADVSHLRVREGGNRGDQTVTDPPNDKNVGGKIRLRPTLAN